MAKARKHIKHVVCALSVLLAFGIQAAPAAKAPKRTVLFVCLTMGNPFYQEMITGLDKAAAGVPGIVLEKRSGKSPTDVKGQVDIIHTFLAAEHDLAGVILVPADSGASIARAVRELNEARIPVINVDIAINMDALRAAGAHVDAFIGSDNVAGGRAAADLVKSRLPKGGRILILLGGLGEATTHDRRQGFVDRLKELQSREGYRSSVIERSAKWSEAQANVETAAVLASEKIDAIFAENDLLALGAANAVAARQGGTHLLIVGYDYIPEARKALDECRLAGDVSQNPAFMGQRAIETLAVLWHGGKPTNAREFTPVSSKPAPSKCNTIR